MLTVLQHLAFNGLLLTDLVFQYLALPRARSVLFSDWSTSSCLAIFAFSGVEAVVSAGGANILLDIPPGTTDL